MTIEEVVDRTVQLQEKIEIDYCTRSGREFTCLLENVRYSSFYGGLYIEAFCTNWGETRTFKISRILRVNGHGYNPLTGGPLTMNIKTGEYETH